MSKRKPAPKLYRIETFRLRPLDHARGMMTEYLAAGNTRRQAIAACNMQDGEVILSIRLVGNKVKNTRYWREDL